MKRLIYIFLILLGFTSCVKNDRVLEEDPEASGEKVELVFGVKLPEMPETKVMADNPQVTTLHVAVFGGSGFLKEYVQAEPLSGATTNGDEYSYKVRLSLSDSHLKVHFIANGPSTLPFRYEDEVMSALSTSNPQDAYWQKIELPNGITAQKNPDGTYIKVNGEYQVTNETKAYFQHIPLIRNFAKIEVITDADCEANDFHLISYAVVNKPTKGSIAPYNSGAGSFITDYKDKTYAQLKASYPGNIPADATMDTDIPAPSAFSNAPFYMYERPVPTENPTYILVYGTYKRSNPQKNCYYRLELMDNEGYYAIYRNFRYQVIITSIKREGSDTPEDAVNAAGSGDVSTDTKTENLSDISDGRARLYVEYMEKTIIGGGGTVTLKYKFIPDVNSTSPNPQSNGDDVVITPGAAGSSGAVINGAVTKAASDDSDGWRTLSFTAATASNLTKTQTLNIQGNYTYQGVAHRLFRNVTFKLLETQNLTVVCNPSELEHGAGKLVDVLIKLPKDLPRSFFPMKLHIEVEKLSLTPYNDNLPVYPGKSLVDGTTNTYYFVKELTYDDYLALQDASTDDKVTVTTHFKTTKDASDSQVYVTAQYFNTNHGGFTTYTMKDFTDLKFSNYVQTEPNEPVTFEFDMNGSDVPSTVTLTLTGLKPDPSSATGATLVQIGSSNSYTWTPSGSSASIGLLTTTDGGYYKVELSANHYNNAALDNLQSYNNPRFTSPTGNIGAGASQEVQFAYNYPNAASVQPVTFTLAGLRPRSTDTQFQDLGGGKWLYTPSSATAAQTVYFETTAWNASVSVSMDGDSYYAAGPYTKNAVTSVSIGYRTINFTYRNTRIYVLNSAPTEVTSFMTRNNTSATNNSAVTLQRTNFEDDKIYFRCEYNGQTYYSGPHTAANLTNGIISWTTANPFN